jgi:hypothetical protein
MINERCESRVLKSDCRSEIKQRKCERKSKMGDEQDEEVERS